MSVRLKALARFRSDPQVSVLLMSDIGAIGLDLSFVTHIFLMDEIWDESVEAQVIARGHGMEFSIPSFGFETPPNSFPTYRPHSREFP